MYYLILYLYSYINHTSEDTKSPLCVCHLKSSANKKLLTSPHFYHSSGLSSAGLPISLNKVSVSYRNELSLVQDWVNQIADESPKGMKCDSKSLSWGLIQDLELSIRKAQDVTPTPSNSPLPSSKMANTVDRWLPSECQLLYSSKALLFY